MSARRSAPTTAPESLPPAIPTLEAGVMGPRDQAGYLLRALPDEQLAWDLENEIASTACHWVDEMAGWWIASPYFDTVVDLVLRASASVLVLDDVEGDRLLSRDGSVARQERLF